jgi:hypothetical protein
LANLLKLSERYCVVYQTLKSPPVLSATIETDKASDATEM